MEIDHKNPAKAAQQIADIIRKRELPRIDAIQCNHKYHRSGRTTEECIANQRKYGLRDIDNYIKDFLGKKDSIYKNRKQKAVDLIKQMKEGIIIGVDFHGKGDEFTCDLCKALSGKTLTIYETDLIIESASHYGCSVGLLGKVELL